MSKDDFAVLKQINNQFNSVREKTVAICAPLHPEDCVVQTVVWASPPKWHLAHTTWFFEQFLLRPFKTNYKEFDSDFAYLFNSYYNTVGDRVMRFNRGSLSRPLLQKVLDYRKYVNDQVNDFLGSSEATERLSEWHPILTLGLQHEQQHQELLWTDLKHTLGTQPLKPAYSTSNPVDQKKEQAIGAVRMQEGLYSMGHRGEGFCFDNELGLHQVHLETFEISKGLLPNDVMLAFIKDGGYEKHNLWHDEGWAWVNENAVKSPLYWNLGKDGWEQYELDGVNAIEPKAAIKHVSFYEAHALTQWLGERLPTEFEWEAAAPQLDWGQRWEHTNSAYLPYPRYQKAAGAIGEYNGKFMVNQMVQRGASVATAEGHSRTTYRNFFHPPMQWQFSGVRTVKNNL